MAIESPKPGPAGTSDQSPRWEGPEENRPRGYLPAKDEPDVDRDAFGENNQDPAREKLSDAVKHKDSKQPDPDLAIKGQFAPSQADRKASGVLSAKPTVITGTEDATSARDAPSAKTNDINAKRG